jgi:hypothetical protein
MSTNSVTTNNYATLRVEGMVALSAAGAVGAVVGDGLTVTKTNTGLYSVNYSNPDDVILNEVIGCGAHLVDAAVGTVKDVGIETKPAQTASTGDIAMVFHTVDAAGADVDEATSALEVAFYFVVRTRRMTNPFA